MLPTLLGRVLRNVLGPLALTWLVGTAIALGVANYFTEQTFDRAMLNDAYSLSGNVQAHESDIELTLSPREVASVLFDQLDAVAFAIRREDGSLLAGDAALTPPPPRAGEDYRFSDIELAGRPMRAVMVRHAQPHAFTVVVAHTTGGRNALVRRLLLYALGPQVLLLVLLAAWLGWRIGQDLRPLRELQDALDQRDATELAPVAVAPNTRELQALGEALNSLFLRLGDSVRAQREFAGSVAHELRTPLAGIRALADYGLAQSQPAVWREQLLRIAHSQARASHLVDQLLALALADEGRTGLALTPLRLDELAQQAVLRHLARADARGVDLGATGLEAPVTVVANAALVEGILDNLIDNALRYGGRTITVELADHSLSVADDGPGIAPEARQALMLRWTQGPDGRTLGEGAGLGLSIVARYAQLLGAGMALEDASAQGGLRVRIAFPHLPSREDGPREA